MLMQSLRNALPPLEPLVAFEAAARLGSFTAAAQELNITQAAVSQRIRTLEQALGTNLFERAHRAVHLTVQGREYQHTVSMALTHLANATREIKSAPQGARLTVAADQSIASMWLMPRLPRFFEHHPRIPVRLIASDTEADCLAGDVDLSIVHGDGEWPGFGSVCLFGEEVLPVCSPAYLDRNGPIGDVADLTETVLLDLEDTNWNWINWRMWLTEQGVDLPAGQRHLRINSYPLIIEAARNGQGVALGWRHLVDDALLDGSLVCPLERSVHTRFGYHILWPEARPLSAEAGALRDWALGESTNQPLHRHDV